jgi:glycosyltransferase 2 family protein
MSSTPPRLRSPEGATNISVMDREDEVVNGDTAEAADDLSTQGRRIPWRPLVLYALAFVFFALLLWRSRIWDSGESLDEIDPAMAAAVPLLSILLVPPLALRLRAILISLGHHVSAIALVPVAYYGNAVGFLTPASSGELLRPSLMSGAFGVPTSKGAAAVLFERMYSMYIMCLTGAIAFALTGVIPLLAGIVAIPVFVALSLAPLLVVSVFKLRFTELSARLPHFIQKRVGGLEDASGAFDSLWRSPRLAVVFTALSAALFGVIIFQFWLLVEATGGGISPAEAWVAFFVASLVGLVSGLPLGLGALDATLVSLLHAFGLDLETAGAVAVLTRLLINLPTGLAALLAYVIAVRQSTPASPAPAAIREESAIATTLD